MRLDDCDNKVLLLGGSILLNFLAELCKLYFWALSDAAKLAALLIDCPLSIVLDTPLGDLYLGNFDAHDPT